MGIFRVLFTGLCAYAPDVEFGNEARPPKKVMVLMVNAMRSQQGDELKALDEKPLREHFPVMLFKSDDLTNRGVIPAGGNLRWFFPRHELTFVMDVDQPPPPPPPLNVFNVIQDRSDSNFNHGIHVKEVMGNSLTNSPLDPNCFKDAASKGVIAARVLIEAGKLFTHKLDRVKFHLADTLAGTFKSRPVSNVVALEFEHVKVAHVKARDLDNSAAPLKSIDFDCSKPVVEITIGNLCCESLGLEAPPGGPPLPIEKDDDFRWFYNLFDRVPKGTIKQTVKGVSLPVPVPVLIPQGGGLQPIQCMRLNLHAQTF